MFDLIFSMSFILFDWQHGIDCYIALLCAWNLRHVVDVASDPSPDICSVLYCIVFPIMWHHGFLLHPLLGTFITEYSSGYCTQHCICTCVIKRNQVVVVLFHYCLSTNIATTTISHAFESQRKSLQTCSSSLKKHTHSDFAANACQLFLKCNKQIH